MDSTTTPEETAPDIFAACGEIFGSGLFGDLFETFAPPIPKVSKAKLDSIFSQLEKKGWPPGLTEDSYKSVVRSGIHTKNLGLAAVATEIACNENPLTLRGLFYRVVSAGWLPSTDKEHYGRLGRLLTRLREKGVIPFSWIVDNLRSTEKPSSWTGLNAFLDTVREAYRKDFWANLPDYVHIFCEKDAIAGTIAPVTHEFDVPLSPIRGYVSLSYAHEIAENWSRIDKPIHAYYVGDFDPSGFDLERDVHAKLRRYSTSDFEWTRLGVNADDFASFNLIPLKPKKSDKRFKNFVETHGTRCAELDAIPPNALRARIRQAIEQHVPKTEWEKLQAVENLEKETFDKALGSLQVA